MTSRLWKSMASVGHTSMQSPHSSHPSSIVYTASYRIAFFGHASAQRPQDMHRPTAIFLSISTSNSPIFPLTALTSPTCITTSSHHSCTFFVTRCTLARLERLFATSIAPPSPTTSTSYPTSTAIFLGSGIELFSAT